MIDRNNGAFYWPAAFEGVYRKAATSSHPCSYCGGRMRIIEAFAPGCQPHHQPSATTVAIRINTS